MSGAPHKLAACPSPTTEQWPDLFVAMAGVSAPLAGLLPGQDHVALGIELLVIVAILAVLFAVAGGLYWVATAMVVLTLGAVINAWVLLVEILR